MDLQARLDAALDALWAIAHLTPDLLDTAPKIAWQAFGEENRQSDGEALRKRLTTD